MKNTSSGTVFRLIAPRACAESVKRASRPTVPSSSLATGIRDFKDSFFLHHQDVLEQSQQGRRAFDACPHPVGVLGSIRA